MSLNDWLDNQFPEFSNVEICCDGCDDPTSLPYVIKLLVAASLNKNGLDCVFVVPQPEMIARLVSIFAALSNTKREFHKYKEEFAKKGLVINQRVRLIPSNKIFKYGGYEQLHDESRLRLGLLGKKQNNAVIFLPAKAVFRLFPTERSVPLGDHLDIKEEASLSELDKLLNIESYGNDALFRNRVIIQDSEQKILSFFKEWNLRRTSAIENFEECYIDLLEIPLGIINVDGNLSSIGKWQQTYGEPVIASSGRLSGIDEYCSGQLEDSRTIITSNKRAVIENIADVESLSREQKLIFITDELSIKEASFFKNLDFYIWKLSESDIFPDVIKKTISNSSPFRKLYNSSKTKESDIKIHQANSDVLDRISDEILAIERSSLDQEYKVKIVGAIKRLYWRSQEIIFLPDSAYQDWFLEQIIEIEDNINKNRSFIGSQNISKIKSITEGLLSDIESYNYDKRKILYETIEKYEGNLILIICRNKSALEAISIKLHSTANIEYRSYDELSMIDSEYSVVIMLGWPGKELFRRLLNSGIYNQLVCILYKAELSCLNFYFQEERKLIKFMQLTVQEKSRILNCPISEIDKRVDKEDHDDDSLYKLDDLDAIKIFDIGWVEKPILSDPSLEYKIVEATYVTFDNDSCAYFMDKHKVSVIDQYTNQYKIKTVKDLVVGDIALFRQESDKEILKDVLEKLYPNEYDELLVKAIEWKHWLSKIGSDSRTVWDALVKSGLKKSQMIVSNWMENDQLIGPRDQNDLIIIAKTANIQDSQRQEVMSAIRTLKGWHIKAGVELTKLVMRHLSSKFVEAKLETTALDDIIKSVEILGISYVDVDSCKVSEAIVNLVKPVKWFSGVKNRSERRLKN